MSHYHGHTLGLLEFKLVNNKQYNIVYIALVWKRSNHI